MTNNLLLTAAQSGRLLQLTKRCSRKQNDLNHTYPLSQKVVQTQTEFPTPTNLLRPHNQSQRVQGGHNPVCLCSNLLNPCIRYHLQNCSMHGMSPEAQQIPAMLPKKLSRLFSARSTAGVAHWADTRMDGWWRLQGCGCVLLSSWLQCAGFSYWFGDGYRSCKKRSR